MSKGGVTFFAAVVLTAACGGEGSPPNGGGGNAATSVGAGPSVPSAPSGVQASAGASTDYVTVVWEPVSDATSYDLYRDGELIASDLTGTSYDDSGALPGGVPDAPTNVSASDGLYADEV